MGGAFAEPPGARLLTLARGEDYSISVSSDEYHSVFTVMDGVLSEFS